ncbi:putative monovalent cation/H+ antiporter subunit F [Methanobrevibacter cuticularis]|uniref:Putative monovalent cation/H+ antiporter subunit F n=1 Tax=Methanobrevibacter cuticularis TaxID=47311 RepID=A0A166DJG5_9EURY|nr:monovalent cation/H+ antiporter complex subunit F [Methanobrevibacter cuticularis]KZX15663.1 putative monovalent cation/H+ antiporter subunit F [Methanobrevibacter cuticularis]
MDILLISEYILIIALVIFMLAAVRIITHRTIAMGLIGSATFSLAISVLLLTVGAIYEIEFYKDIALALLILGVVGTIAFSMALRRN